VKRNPSVRGPEWGVLCARSSEVVLRIQKLNSFRFRPMAN
jgi:hypothetical protein